MEKGSESVDRVVFCLGESGLILFAFDWLLFLYIKGKRIDDVLLWSSTLYIAIKMKKKKKELSVLLCLLGLHD